MTEELGGEEHAEGLQTRYANYFRVANNVYEFLFDFAIRSESGTARVHTRIVTNPTCARALSETILESLGRYEQTFGRIPRVDNDTTVE